MKSVLPFTRQDFEYLLAEQRQLVQLINDLEYHLYEIGESASPAVSNCQRTAGTLIARLRNLLFHFDQKLLPVLESQLGGASSTSNLKP